MIGAVEHELIELSHELTRAAQAHDFERLEALLGKEFSLIGAVGELDRGALLGDVAARYAIEDFAYEEIDVEVYGDTAVLSSRYHQTAELDGRDLSGSFLLTDVWVRRDGRWQAVRRHATATAAS